LKKAFSLMEVMISVILLSVVMVSLLQLKVNNIFQTTKSQESKENLDYILISINGDEVDKRNENIYLKDKFNFSDEVRQKIKDKKINIKDELVDTYTIENNDINLNIDIYATKYTLENSGNSKTIYSFKLQ